MAADITARTRKFEQRARREAHFADGGTTATWIGRGILMPDRKKVASRKACRGARVQDF